MRFVGNSGSRLRRIPLGASDAGESMNSSSQYFLSSPGVCASAAHALCLRTRASFAYVFPWAVPVPGWRNIRDSLKHAYYA